MASLRQATWTTASAGDGPLAQGTLAPAEAPFTRHPKTTDGLTHGWRWYRVVDGRLLSPLAPGRIELPRNGSLDYGPHYRGCLAGRTKTVTSQGMC